MCVVAVVVVVECVVHGSSCTDEGHAPSIVHAIDGMCLTCVCVCGTRKNLGNHIE
jgi:hypothetical protein